MLCHRSQPILQAKGMCNLQGQDAIPKGWLQGFATTFKTSKRKINLNYYLFIFSGSAAQRGLWPPRSRGSLITLNDAPQSVGLLWTSDQLVAETSTWQHTTHRIDKHPCPRWNSKPTIAAAYRPWTYALDRAATGTGILNLNSIKEFTSQFIENIRCLWEKNSSTEYQQK
jgi:hypothetical protein